MRISALVSGILPSLLLPILLSADPLDHWQVRRRPSSPTNNLAAVSYGSGRFVAVGNHTLESQDRARKSAPRALSTGLFERFPPYPSLRAPIRWKRASSAAC